MPQEKHSYVKQPLVHPEAARLRATGKPLLVRHQDSGDYFSVSFTDSTKESEFLTKYLVGLFNHRQKRETELLQASFGTPADFILDPVWAGIDFEISILEGKSRTVTPLILSINDDGEIAGVSPDSPIHDFPASEWWRLILRDNETLANFRSMPLDQLETVQAFFTETVINRLRDRDTEKLDVDIDNFVREKFTPDQLNPDSPLMAAMKSEYANRPRIVPKSTSPDDVPDISDRY